MRIEQRSNPRESSQTLGGTSSSPRHLLALSCNWDGQRPGMPSSSDGGASASPRGMVTTDPSNAYQGVATAWASGPAVMYDTLASVAITGVAGELRGASVLDVGAGTGALCRALRVAGAIPFAVDTSVDMLGQVGDAAALAIAGDMCALPFADRSFDAAVSGFAISHIDEPARALVEMRRVVRSRGRVVAVRFGEAEDRAS